MAIQVVNSISSIATGEKSGEGHVHRLLVSTQNEVIILDKQLTIPYPKHQQAQLVMTNPSIGMESSYRPSIEYITVTSDTAWTK